MKKIPSENNSLAIRALNHFKNNTTDQAKSTMRIPIEAYRDPIRFANERERIFKQLPQGIALSIELPEQGDFVTRTVLETPVLLTRNLEGKVNAFLNICRHRGAILCNQEQGQKRMFVCPYHSWSYDIQGRLLGINGPQSFGEVDKDNSGLTPLNCTEKHGIIWICLDPTIDFDIDKWLGDFGNRLDSLELDNWHLFETRELEGPGWKAAMDGYLEVYHHDTVHGKTVGQHTIGNLLVHDTYGPHQRLTFGRKNISELEDLKETNFEGEKFIRLIHSVFPNLSISGILGEHCLVSQVYPTKDFDKTITRQSLLCSKKPENAYEQKSAETFSKMTLQAVRDEDYAVVQTIQDGLKTNANSHFTFGRNEKGLQHYHQWVERFMKHEKL